MEIADQQANDYYNISGTSMAAPFVAGAAGLVIDAMQQAGTTWSFASSAHPLFVKMILSATATETNINRENGNFNPELNRNATGSGDSSGWPARKDHYEGFGIINPDAAVEAVLLNYSGASEMDTFPGTVTGRRAWARNMSLTAGALVDVELVVPGTGDFDIYLFSETPDAKGNPALLASSTTAGSGANESISFTPSTTETAYLVVKRVSGNGTFTFSGGVTAITVSKTASPTSVSEPGGSVTFTVQDVWLVVLGGSGRSEAGRGIVGELIDVVGGANRHYQRGPARVVGDDPATAVADGGGDKDAVGHRRIGLRSYGGAHRPNAHVGDLDVVHHPINDNVIQGRAHRVRATATIIFEDLLAVPLALRANAAKGVEVVADRRKIGEGVGHHVIADSVVGVLDQRWTVAGSCDASESAALGQR